MLLENPATHVVEVVSDDPSVVHVVEQVAVDLRTLGIGFGDLADVDTTGSPAGVVLVLRRNPETGVYGLEAFDNEASQGLGHHHIQWAAAKLWQIPHGLAFYPAGAIAMDTLGNILEYDKITHPLPGVTELWFGDPVAGTADVS